MKKILLILVAVVIMVFLWFVPQLLREKRFAHNERLLETNPVTTLENINKPYANMSLQPYSEVKQLLRQPAYHLSENVINKVINTMHCAEKQGVSHNPVLTIIDYSLPSNEKRLWVFDLTNKKLLFNTYVSHGIKSGTLLSQFFSNKYNSKASSLGIYKTEKSYYGRHGPSLQLAGLEYGFNDNASGRAIVMHGGWYVEENFIKKYGRAGRSWGCPAVPSELIEPMINVLKDQSLFVAYYPNDMWLSKSRFLHCDSAMQTDMAEAKPLIEEQQNRADVLLTAIGKNYKSEENQAIVTVKADDYLRLFHTAIPLDRMLRRQIDQLEYIALSNAELKNIATTLQDNINAINFVAPVIKMQRGYYATEMKIINFGKIKSIKFTDGDVIKHFTVYFENRPEIILTTTDRFIRWLGL